MPSVISLPVEKSRTGQATQWLRLEQRFGLYRGGELPRLDIAYETWGRLSPARDNAVLLFSGLSPSAHAASSALDPSPGWWEYMIGPGKPLDTDRLFVIAINTLGSCWGSTGPSSRDPRTGQPYRLNFPELSIEDIARTGQALLRHLGIERLHTLLGTSLGGMAAMALNALSEGICQRLALVCSAASASAFAIGIRSLQRDIVCADPNWCGGDYDFCQPPLDGLRLARKLGLTSYRSGGEWQERFGRQRRKELRHGPFDHEFEIESYLDYNADKFARSFDANSYLYLSRAMDWFDLAEHGGSLSAAFARSGAGRHLVIGVESDMLMPIWQQQEMVDALMAAGKQVSFSRLGSVQGHDAFLIDKERFAPAIADFVNADV